MCVVSIITDLVSFVKGSLPIVTISVCPVGDRGPLHMVGERGLGPLVVLGRELIGPLGIRMNGLSRVKDRRVCWYPAVDQTITPVGPGFESPKIICDGGWLDRPSFGDVCLIIDPPCNSVILREEQIGGQPPIPSITLVIPPTTVKVFHLVGVPFDDPSPLDRSPERLVPSLPQLPM